MLTPQASETIEEVVRNGTDIKFQPLLSVSVVEGRIATVVVFWLYPGADAVIVAVPVDDEEEKLEVHEPPAPVVQLVGVREPRLVVNDTKMPLKPFEVVAVIIDEMKMVITDGLAER